MPNKTSSENQRAFAERAEDVMYAMFGEKHHHPRVKITPGRLEFNTYGPISTYDFDHLTRLVIAAHDFCVRVSISQSGPKRIKIVLHDRKREGDVTEKHPTMEEAIETIRKRYPFTKI
jgi:hypothetical protein